MTLKGQMLSFIKKGDSSGVAWDNSLSKAVNSQEKAVKEKHIRRAIIGTYHERGVQTFWECLHRIPLKENPIICWKFCHLLHKVLREGHENVLQDSQRYKHLLNEHARFWSYFNIGGYEDLAYLYCTLLSTKLTFHMKNSKIPGDLNVDEHALIESTGGSEAALFSLATDMFDYLDCVVDLQCHTIECTNEVSMTKAGQCRLKPLIPCIQDSMILYDLITKIMFRLHSKMSPGLLNGHRDRFLKFFTGLQKFYEKAMSLQYFKNLIDICHLPKYPPNFLVASGLQNYEQPTRVTVVNDTTESIPVPNAGVMALYMQKDRQVKDLEYKVDGLKMELERLKMQAEYHVGGLKLELERLKMQSKAGTQTDLTLK